MHNTRILSERGFSAALAAVVIGVAAIIAVAYYYTAYNVQPAPENEAVMQDKGNTMMKEDDAMMQDTMMEDGAMTDEDSSIHFTGAVLAGNTTKLYDFNKTDYDAAVASGKIILLYFYANWCPICKAETANALYPAFDELAREDVVGFRVNYNDSDTDEAEKELAREFGVAYQHTKVILKNDTRLLKSPEQWSKNRYKDELAKVL